MQEVQSIVKSSAVKQSMSVALAGNPNSGKSSFFNLLTGQYQRTGNYPGVTVERKEGRLKLADGTMLPVIDLPGTYSLDASSPDEYIAQEIVLGLRQDIPEPDIVVVVVDATNLERSLYLVCQLMEFGKRVLLCLNMFDVATRQGLNFDLKRAAHLLGHAPVPTVAIRGHGKSELVEVLGTMEQVPVATRPYRMAADVEKLRAAIAADIGDRYPERANQADYWAGKILGGRWPCYKGNFGDDLRRIAEHWRAKINDSGIDANDFVQDEIDRRHSWAECVCKEVVRSEPSKRST